MGLTMVVALLFTRAPITAITVLTIPADIMAGDITVRTISTAIVSDITAVGSVIPHFMAASDTERWEGFTGVAAGVIIDSGIANRAAVPSSSVCGAPQQCL